MKKKQPIKQILICILVLYLAFTAIPALIFRLAGPNSETTPVQTPVSLSENPENGKTPAFLSSQPLTDPEDQRLPSLPKESLLSEPTEETGSQAEENLEEPIPTDTTQEVSTASASAETLSKTESEALSPSETAQEIPGFLDELAIFGTPTAANPSDCVFQILDRSTGEILSVPLEEFLPAAVLCEMPPSAPEEALKAQAVACSSYYRWQQAHANPSEPEDFSCSTADWQVYVTRSQMEERWGEDFDSYYTRVKRITDSIGREVLTTEEGVICATYFAVSNGQTESAQAVWGEDRSYLQTVASPGDRFSADYHSSKRLSPDSLSEILTGSFPEASFDFSSEPDSWFQSQVLSDAGYTLFLTAGGVKLTGLQLRTALSLSSSSFQVSYDGDEFLFQVTGYGHGVGMSQTGAMYMAEQGSTYDEILSHYYQGSVLSAI